ncbi:MAG: GFA family protein [Azospirillaceae bacterium]
MHLEGSCHCGAVRFAVEAYAPVPYLRCYCSICRKTAGGGGFAINLGAYAATLTVEGEGSAIGVYRARIDGRQSTGERRFCARCGSALWVFDPDWPDLVHPFASAIDTPLPAAPEHGHVLLDSKASWVPVDAAPDDPRHAGYPDESLEAWHRRHGLLDGGGEG